MSRTELDWAQVVMLVVMLVAFGFMVVKMLWGVLCQLWGNAFEGMADQGDDWSPFPWSGKPKRKCIYVLPKRNPLIEIIVDPSRPAWHSAVGVELASREVGA